MRLGRENTLIFCGTLLMLLPWLGLPADWKLSVAALIGIAVLVLALSVRQRVVILKRRLRTMPAPRERSEIQ